jgi:hypothetical protein
VYVEQNVTKKCVVRNLITYRPLSLCSEYSTVQSVDVTVTFVFQHPALFCVSYSPVFQRNAVFCVSYCLLCEHTSLFVSGLLSSFPAPCPVLCLLTVPCVLCHLFPSVPALSRTPCQSYSFVLQPTSPLYVRVTP